MNKMSNGPWGNGDDDSRRQGPWGKSSESGQKRSTSVDEAIDLVQKRLKNTFNGGGGDGIDLSPFMIIMIAVVIFIVWLMTGFYRVQEGELAVVTRFGELARISSAGLRYHLPAPIEEVTVRKVAAVNTIDGGLGNSRNNDDNAEQTLILTGDENMVHTDYTVLWKIKDVTAFLFTARNPEATIKVAAESVIRETIGQTTAKAALTEGRDSIGSSAQVHLQKLMDQYGFGVQIVSIQLQNVAPPREVIESFNGLQASLTDADRMINEAEAYRNDIIPRARGLATQITAEADADKQEKIYRAEGEASQFSKVYDAYQKSPRIALKRYYLDTMQEVLSGVDKVIIDPKAGNNILPYLPLPGLKQKEPSKELGGKNE